MSASWGGHRPDLPGEAGGHYQAPSPLPDVSGLLGQGAHVRQNLRKDWGPCTVPTPSVKLRHSSVIEGLTSVHRTPFGSPAPKTKQTTNHKLVTRESDDGTVTKSHCWTFLLESFLRMKLAKLWVFFFLASLFVNCFLHKESSTLRRWRH